MKHPVYIYHTLWRTEMADYFIFCHFSLLPAAAMEFQIEHVFNFAII